MTSHPTADELYSLVRKRLPSISLGTVYRNLVALSDAGVILKLPGSPMRFDGDTCAHHHIRCEHCSRGADLQVDAGLVDVALIQSSTDWQLTGQQIEFIGICPDCCTDSEWL